MGSYPHKELHMEPRVLHPLRIPKSTRLYTHPHPDPAHVMRSYRKYILGEKRTRQSRRGARGLIHYMEIVLEYLAAKRLVIENKKK